MKYKSLLTFFFKLKVFKKVANNRIRTGPSDYRAGTVFVVVVVFFLFLLRQLNVSCLCTIIIQSLIRFVANYIPHDSIGKSIT